MNPAWLIENWKLIAALALIAALGVQSHRAQGFKAERDLLALEKTERARRDAQRDATNLKNKERTNEQDDADRKRAAAVRVQSQPAAGAIRNPTVELPAASGDQSAFVFDRGRLGAELAAYAERDAARLNQLVAAISQRLAERLTLNAQQGEEVSAAYRACRAFELNRVDLQDQFPASIFRVESFAPGESASRAPESAAAL